VEDSTSSLSKLRIATKNTSSSWEGGSLKTRQSIEATARLQQDTKPSSFHVRPLQSVQQGQDERVEEAKQPETTFPVQTVGDLQAEPSAFARVLLPSYDSAIPFASNAPTSSAEPDVSFDFKKPSPDDVVLKAQTFKGPR
jgi:hypothetical protein